MNINVALSFGGMVVALCIIITVYRFATRLMEQLHIVQRLDNALTVFDHAVNTTNTVLDQINDLSKTSGKAMIKELHSLSVKNGSDPDFNAWVKSLKLSMDYSDNTIETEVETKKNKKN